MIAATVPNANGKLILKAELTSVVASVGKVDAVGLMDEFILVSEEVALALILPLRSSLKLLSPIALSTSLELPAESYPLEGGMILPKTGSNVTVTAFGWVTVTITLLKTLLVKNKEIKKIKRFIGKLWILRTLGPLGHYL